jgi:CubicO group peptidase (beta-lactamase class C family)
LVAGVIVAGLLPAAGRAEPVLAPVDKALARWDRKDAPGVIVGVAQHGAIVHARGYGMANLEHGIPLTAGTISESGSVAKQFTAAAVVLLAVRGQLDLDAPVRTHLTELPEVMARITPRMLLGHTSGIRDIHGLFDLLGRPSYSSMHTNDEALRVIARQRALNFAPGAEYVYSNGGYIVAAELVERVTRQALNVFCTEQLFGPRGMKDTRWRDDFTAVIPHRATGYAPRPAGGWRIDLPYSNLIGNGGLLTTVGDLLRWTGSLDGATGEWGRVVRELQTPLKLNDGRPLVYGLGLTVETDGGGEEISHGGATAGFRTYLTRYPAKGTSIAVLSNAANCNAQGVARSVARAVLNLPPEPRPARVAVEPAALTALAGLYHSATTDGLTNVVVRNGTLALGEGELVPTGPGVFVSPGGATTYRFAAGGDRVAPRLTVTSANATTEFVRRERAAPAASALAAYAGNYASEELDVGFAVTVVNGRLRLERWPGDPAVGEATFADGFRFGREWHATFRRDAAGNVTAMELTNSSGRCRRVGFVRR